MKKFRVMAAVIILLAGVMCAAAAQASVITLSDQNSTAQIDPSSQAGMYSWSVNGNDILYQQWFWYRIGATGGQQSIDTISAPVVTQYSPGLAQVAYTSQSLSVNVTYSLNGGGLNSGSADMGEQIRIVNLSSSAITLHFFEYSDFDLMGPSNDSAALTNANTITQKNQLLSVAETVVTPAPARWQISYYPVLLSQLNGGTYTLSNANNTTVGDISWAFEWDVTLGAFGTPTDGFLISKDKQVTGIPEPGILLLLGSGLIGFLATRKRFGKND